jgi:hypothetical protein
MVIDQSGRIVETQRATIIALADKKKSYTIFKNRKERSSSLGRLENFQQKA